MWHPPWPRFGLPSSPALGVALGLAACLLLPRVAAGQAVQTETRQLDAYTTATVRWMPGYEPGDIEGQVQLTVQVGARSAQSAWTPYSLRCSAPQRVPPPQRIALATVLSNVDGIAHAVLITPRCGVPAGVAVTIDDAGPVRQEQLAQVAALEHDGHQFNYSLVVLETSAGMGTVATWISLLADGVEAIEPVLDVASIAGSSVRATRAVAGSRSFLSRFREDVWRSVGDALPEQHLVRRAIAARYSPNGRLTFRVLTFTSETLSMLQNAASLATDRELRDCRTFGEIVHAALLGDLPVCITLHALDALARAATSASTTTILYRECRRHPGEWVQIGDIETLRGQRATLQCDAPGCTVSQSVVF